MAKIVACPSHNHAGAVRTVRNQLSNMNAALQVSQVVGPEEAQQIIAEGFVTWAVQVMRSDENPEGSARELCREILSQMATAMHGGGGSAA